MMLKIIGAGFFVAVGALGFAAPTFAFETSVTQIEKNSDGSMTFHFAVKVDQGETLTPGASKAAGDFTTIYNFYGLVDGSVKSPTGWEFSSEEFGRTPTMNGYPSALPVDVPNTPNLTWTVTKTLAGPVQVEGFTATTHAKSSVQGEYSAQLTRRPSTVKGTMPAEAMKEGKQALIGVLPAPSFLADAK